MSEPFLVGLDLGGGGVRCLAVGAESGRLAGASRRWKLLPDPADPLASRLDVERIGALLGEATRQALARAGASPRQVAGIAAAAMRHGSVLLDASGDVLLATSNRDARGAGHSLALAAEHGEALLARTGHWPNPVQAAARLRWLAERDAALLERAATHLSVAEWIAFRLCGERAAEPSQAIETGLFALSERDWARDWIERLGLPQGLFPQPLDAGTRLGKLGPEAAESLGLPPGLPVAVGGADTQCGLLGAGVVESGQLGAVAGSSAPVLRVLPAPPSRPPPQLWSVHHLAPDRWALESNAGGVGEGLAWMAGLLYPDATHPELALVDEAARSQPGATGLRADVGAQVMDARQLRLPVSNLTFTHLSGGDEPRPRRHLARAVLEGLAYALRANVEQLESVSGLGPSPLRLGGGLSRSALFAGIVSDVLGQPVERAPTPETTALGAAICAGVGAGLFEDLAHGAQRLASPRERHEPDPERSRRYGELYAEWQSLREARSEHDSRAAPMLLSELRAPGSGPGAADAGFRPRILVTADLDDAGLDALRGIGEVEYQSYRQAMRMLQGDALVEALAGVQVFVTEVDKVDAAALRASPELRVVAVCRGDAVNLDLETASALGVPVIHTPGRNADAVAELALGFMLMLARKLPEAAAFLREPGGVEGDLRRMGRAFFKLRGHELWGSTVGLVGLGAVARKLAQRLRPCGAHCVACDPFMDDDAVRLAGAEPLPLPELLERSDIVSLHAAVTDDSRGLIGRAELERMKPGAFLVNTARAALVDPDALLEALRSGHLGGAALDVFPVEPPGADHPLLALPNVIATPHVGGNTYEVSAHQARMVAAALERMCRGQRPDHLLNPETWTTFSWTRARNP